MAGRYISQPHPEDVRRIVTALLQPTPPQVLDITCIPEPWRSPIMRLGRSHLRPEPVMYGLTAYCAQRATHPSITPAERDEWIAVHELARRSMRLRRRGGPSKQLDRSQRLRWKLIYEELREAFECLPRSRDPGDGVVKLDVRAVRGCLRRFSLSAPQDAIEEIRTGLAGGRTGRTWDGLQAFLAAQVGLSQSEFRRQVVEWRRTPRNPSPDQRKRHEIFLKIVRARNEREADRLRRQYEKMLPPLPPPLGIVARKTPSS